MQTDLDNRSNVLIISKYGKEMEVKKGIRAFYSISKFFFFFLINLLKFYSFI